MTYTEKRGCAEILGGLLSYKMGFRVRVRLNPNPDPRLAANEQAGYGLAKLEERVRHALDEETNPLPPE